MRILRCGFPLVGGLWFSDAARRVVAANGGGTRPTLEVHHVHADESPAAMDKYPVGRWVVGYSDADECVRFLAPPSMVSGWLMQRSGEGESQVGVSADGKRVVVVFRDWMERRSQRLCFSRTAKGNWSEKWKWNAAGLYYGPVWLFRNDTRVVLRRQVPPEKYRPRSRSHLIVCRTSDGAELAESPLIVGEVSRGTSLGSSLVVCVDAPHAKRASTTLRVFGGDAVDGGSFDVPQRSPVTAIAADPFGRFLLSAGGSKVTAWDPVSWKPLHAFDWKIGRVRCLAVSHDGTVAAAGGDKGKVAIWDVG